MLMMLEGAGPEIQLMGAVQQPADVHNAGLGFGGLSPTKPAGARHAGFVFRGARAPRNQLMLMMLGSILGHGPAEPPDAPDAGHGFGCGDPTKTARPHKAS